MCSRLRWIFRSLFLLAITPSVVSVASAGDSQWIEVKSPNYSVVTDASEKCGRETAMRFEQMRAVFGALMTKANVNLPITLQIVAFRNSGSDGEGSVNGECCLRRENLEDASVR